MPYKKGDPVMTAMGDATVLEVLDDGRLKVLLDIEGSKRDKCERIVSIEHLEYLPSLEDIERDKIKIRKKWVPRCDPRIYGNIKEYPAPDIPEEKDYE